MITLLENQSSVWMQSLGWALREEAVASNRELASGLDQFTMDSEAPVQPDSEGRYPVAMPGFTKVL